MLCLDCAAIRQERAAVAICITCGAAICFEHIRIGVLTLTRPTHAGMAVMQVPVNLPARQVRCSICSEAHEAATRPEAGERSLRWRRRSPGHINGE